MYHNKYILSVLICCAAFFLQACGSDSSDSDNNTEIRSYSISTVSYGKSLSTALSTQTHSMDIYQPSAEDTSTARPLIIYAHGGFFMFGNKIEASTNEIGEFFARSGYVLASINYRLISNDINAKLETDASAVLARLNFTDISQLSTGSLSLIANIDAMSDMRAAIRYFLADASATNTYRIDTKNIFVAGYSAGAFSALNTAFINSLDDLPSTVESKPSTAINLPDNFASDYLTSRGGLQGDNDGNTGYSSIGKIRGIINLAGAVGATSTVKADIPPILSIIGSDDTIVPVAVGEVEESGHVTVYGPQSIHTEAEKHNVKNTLVILNGVTHNLWDCTSGTQCNDINTTILNFTSDIMQE